MELHTIRGGNKDELEAKAYNLGIGISLGNKWFSPGNIASAALWALPYTREYVLIYVADSIHSINLEVRNRISHDKALRRALDRSEVLFEEVKKQISRLPETDRRRIAYATWESVSTSEYKQKVSYLYSLYESNAEFREHIKGIVRNHVSKEIRTFTEEEITKFGTYILEELPEVLARVPMGEFICDAYLYPFDGPLTVFVGQLQKGELFPRVKENILDTEPKVFLEVR